MSTKEELHERLFSYVKQQNIDSIKELLAEGANATVVTSNGLSAIGEAAAKGLVDILKILLESCDDRSSSFSGSPKKARTNAEVNHTPESMDGLQWDDEIQGNSVHSNDEWSELYLYYARTFEQTSELLADLNKVKDPHCLDRHGWAPIHYATLHGHINCVKMLLDFGCPVDIQSRHGMTPMHMAIANTSLMEVLLQHNANPNSSTFDRREKPLHFACRIGKLDSVKLLVENGGNIEATNDSHQTSLMVAVSWRQIHVARYLIGRNAKLNTESIGGQTSLCYAVENKDIDMTSLLLQSGARLVASHLLLHKCVVSNCLNIAEILVDAGANVNYTNSTGSTPFFAAIRHNNAEMVNFLIKNGALRSETTLKPRDLHLAVSYAQCVEKFAKVCHCLISHGAHVDDVNEWNDTALLLALVLEKYRVAEFLIKEGADVNKRSIKNVYNNLSLARTAKNVNLLVLMVNAGAHLPPRPENLRSLPLKDVENDIEDCLAYHCVTPLSLQKLCRIKIRNCLMDNFNQKTVSTSNPFESKLKQLVKGTGLPPALQNFVYKFDDLRYVTESRVFRYVETSFAYSSFLYSDESDEDLKF